MRNIKQFESFSKESEIHDICKKYYIEDYTINDDMSIDVEGSVDLSSSGLTELPLTFNIIENYFDCSLNSLTSLMGAPRKCGNFYCSSNNLTTLKGAPIKCRDFYCFDNNLTSLEGAPGECEHFDCANNNLTSLKGAPKKCKFFYCSANPNLRTLEYVPSIEYINIYSTAISSFEYLSNSFEICTNDKLKHICDLIYKDLDSDTYVLDEIELFNDYRIIDDKDYVNNKADKATLNMFKLKDFLEELKIDKEINIKELEKHFYIK